MNPLNIITGHNESLNEYFDLPNKVQKMKEACGRRYSIVISYDELACKRVRIMLCSLLDCTFVCK